MTEHRDTVIGDRGNAQALRFELLRLFRQLDELTLAVRSPVGRPHEGQHQPLRTPQILERPLPARLIAQLERRYPRAHLGSRLDLGKKDNTRPE
jgi:hypothetical protein